MSDFENGCSGDCAGCGSDCVTDGEATVTLILDDGTELECAVLTIFPAGDNQYIALLPMKDGEVPEDGDVYLYRYEEEDGQPNLANIEDDDEYEMVADAFDEFLDNEAFDEMEDDTDD